MLFDDDWHHSQGLSRPQLSQHMVLDSTLGILACSTQHQNIMAQNLAAALCGKYLTQSVVKKDFKKY